MNDLLETIKQKTEFFLTWRKARLRRKKEKQKKKNPIVDWLEAFLWAAVVVLIINQYLLQAYQIPSGSMMNTLLISDRIFVNKVVFGPELLPGLFKVSSFVEPKRGEVIIFENPSYISRGPTFDIIQRILYMVTLSLLDIDKDENGMPKAHFLIKRAVGTEHDRIRQRSGNLEILPKGEDRWMGEGDFKKLSGLSYPVRRLIPEKYYVTLREAGKAAAFHDLRLPLDDNKLGNLKTAQNGEYFDGFAFDEARTKTLYSINPQDRKYGGRWRTHQEGVYIPEGKILPLGDNRDNSRDGRYFGAVKESKILGKAMFRYWPLPRVGFIR